MALQTIHETWWDEYQVHLADLDVQHKRMDELFQELEREMQQGGDTGSALSSVVHYATFHFADEEQYMEHWKYPGLLEHRAVHQRVLEHFSRMAREVEDGSRLVTRELASTLHALIASHVDNEDRKYNDFLKVMRT